MWHSFTFRTLCEATQAPNVEVLRPLALEVNMASVIAKDHEFGFLLGQASVRRPVFIWLGIIKLLQVFGASIGVKR